MAGVPLRATYRLQFRDGMTFARAASLVPYWQRLGISHLYASPVFAAAPDSSHGYDVADFNRLEAALGGEEGFRALSAALHGAGLALILDFVPNHMSDSSDNPWWHDVLEWGERSRFAGHFDIDWSVAPLLRPLLGRPYAEALEASELAFDLDVASATLGLRYFDAALPLTPPSYALLFDGCGVAPVRALARAFATATPATAAAVRGRLAAVLSDAATTADLTRALAELSNDHELVHAVHEAQPWRLALWRAARDSLNYRRFFEITGLVGVRVEEPAVFDDVHRLLLRLVEEGAVDGIRLDHIDGLADPAGYLRRLGAALPGGRDIPIHVEKILEPGEVLPPGWPVTGTTGYEFAAALAGGLTDGAGLAALGSAYDAFVGAPIDWAAEVSAAKLQIISENLAAELAALTRQAVDIAARQLAARDYGEDSLRRAIVALIVAFPVYRSYVDAEGTSAGDRALIGRVTERAKAEPDVEDPGPVDFVTSLLQLDVPPEEAADALRFVARFQQTTGPVMAKALEDTAFYRWHRLIALNEVGGDPDPADCSARAFHDAMLQRARTQPHGLSATATHDTKRGEDARARLYVLSEDPAGWAAAVARWTVMNASLRTELADGPAPEPETEWLIYQALLGAWPVSLDPADAAGVRTLADRFAGYLEKALREAKQRTRWTAPNQDYEAAVAAFAAGLLAPGGGFLADFAATIEPFCRAGAVNSLAQLLLKLAAPGVPDIYQGTEDWDFSLVDPDNRRPVDFAGLAAALDRADRQSPAEALAGWRAAQAKLRLLHAGLALRRSRADLFAAGDYLPLDVSGRHADRVIAFARTTERDALLVVAPRRPLGLLPQDGLLVPAESWSDTAVALPARLRAVALRDVDTATTVTAEVDVAVAALLHAFPVACCLAERVAPS